MHQEAAGTPKANGLHAMLPTASGALKILMDTEESWAVLLVDCEELELTDTAIFWSACQKLVETAQNELVINLYSLRALPSTFVDPITWSCSAALGANRNMAVLASGVVGRVLKLIMREPLRSMVHEMGPESADCMQALLEPTDS